MGAGLSRGGESAKPQAPGGTGLRFNCAHPVDAHYVAQCCGARIEHWQKAGMIAAAMDLPDYGFAPELPEPGRHPSWHIDAIASNFPKRQSDTEFSGGTCGPIFGPDFCNEKPLEIDDLDSRPKP